jgi:hypothetical protein
MLRIKRIFVLKNIKHCVEHMVGAKQIFVSILQACSIIKIIYFPWVGFVFPFCCLQVKNQGLC